VNKISALVQALRPKQWTKNAVVMAALVFAAGDRSQQIVWLDLLGQAVAAAILFCLASSAIYLLNDIKDVELDRAHPEKKFRPIASGALAPGLAFTTALVLTAIALAGAWLINL